uniref:Uncharacterized protein n=1 Tax=Arundo donax TaxID=35708 RepID=A0A0A9G4A9_ARUDO
MYMKRYNGTSLEKQTHHAQLGSINRLDCKKRRGLNNVFKAVTYSSRYLLTMLEKYLETPCYTYGPDYMRLLKEHHRIMWKMQLTSI